MSWRQYFFYRYPWSSRKNFSDKLIASDLLMLRIIQQQLTFLIVIIAISLILRHNVALRILKFESMIEKAIVTNHTFFVVATSCKINSFAYINSIIIQNL